MLLNTNWKAISTFLAATILASWAPLAHGQRPAIRPNIRPAAGITPLAAYRVGAVQGGYAGYRAGFRRAAGMSPYWPGGSYSSYSDPYGAYEGALGDANDAGQAMISVEQAMQMREQYRQMKIDTRRKMFDEWLDERAKTPTLEDQREKARLENLKRGRNDPPLTEIWDAKALNDLLVALQNELPRSEGAAPTVALDPEVVARINVTSGATLGSVGVLKDGGKLHWPLTLKEEVFEASRTQLEQLVPKALERAKACNLRHETIQAMTANITQMVDQLNDIVGTIKTRDFIESKRYLTELDGAIKVLRDPAAPITSANNGQPRAKRFSNSSAI
jgi:hypothetical protein